MAGKELFLLLFPQGPVLDHRFNAGGVKLFVGVHGIGRLVVGQGAEAPLRQVRFGLVD